MNRILTIGMAAVAATFFAQPVYADKGGGHGGGGHNGGGGGHMGNGNGGGRISAPHISAPAMHANNNHSMHFQSAPHFESHAPSVAHSRVQPTINNDARAAQTRSFAQHQQQRSFQRQQKAPSIAFGGHVINNGNNNHNDASANAPRNGAPQQFSRSGNGSDARHSRAPAEVSRHWDHNRVHEWNHHRYRWYGGDWVILDADPYFYGGYGYGPYGYDYDATPYSSPAYSYDYSSSESVAASVQDRLMRRGYSPGPVDGVVGAQTRDAIADFQNDHGLPVTGQIDDGLLRALGL